VDQLSFLEPRGNICDTKLFPLNNRPDDLNGKKVYFINIGKHNADKLLQIAMRLLKNSFTDVDVVYYPKTTSFNQPEPEEWWKEIEANADAAVIAPGD